MGERAVFTTSAHVFQIDQETKKKWIPSSSSAIKVAFYHDPARKTYRVIAIENSKALVNSTITANMNFTKTSPKFGQWSDHRANTVYGLGFSSEKDLLQFVGMFDEAKQAAKELVKEKQLTMQKLQDQDKPHPPAGSTPSPTSPPVKSPSVISPPVSTSSSTSKSPSPSSLTSPGSYASTGGVSSEGLSSEGREREEPKEAKGTRTKSKKEEDEPVVNGSHLEPIKISNGVGSSGEAEISPNGQLDSLKSENNRLKLALASSGTNVKKWESEMQTLKNNNSRLHTALEESKVNVSQWKAQLQKYKEENDSLKKKMEQAEELGRKESAEAVTLRKENEELKEVLSVVQIDLETRTAEVQELESRNEAVLEELGGLKSRTEVLEEENANLSGQVALLEDQLKMASVASSRKMEDAQQKHRELGLKLRELLKLHENLASHLAA